MTLLSGIEVDCSRHPLVVVRNGKRYSDQDFEAMIREVTRLVRSGPFGMINDTRGAAMPTPLQRRALVRFYDTHEREVSAHFMACGIVGDSTLVRGVLTALSWLRSPPHPFRVFAGLGEAEEWVVGHLPRELAGRVPGRNVEAAQR